MTRDIDNIISDNEGLVTEDDAEDVRQEEMRQYPYSTGEDWEINPSAPEVEDMFGKDLNNYVFSEIEGQQKG